MKILPTIITLLTIQLANAQSGDQKDIVDILNVALRHSKLPDELINRSNPEFAPWTNAPFIVVKSDSAKNLGTLPVAPDNTQVWIFDYEQIFLLDIGYGLVPVSITRKNNRVTLDYKTVRYWTNKNNACHSGRIVAERKGDIWVLVKSKAEEVKCEIDIFG